MENQNNKYYTPEIEEFHVGFEFEFIDKKNEWKKSDDFSFAFLADDTDTISEVSFYLEKNKVRVKYLDVKDLEILGWKILTEERKIRLNISEDYLFTHYGEFKTKDLNNQLVYLTFWNIENYHLNIHIDCGDEEFRGIIKNKNELKRLMRQLNIL